VSSKSDAPQPSERQKPYLEMLDSAAVPADVGVSAVYVPCVCKVAGCRVVIKQNGQWQGQHCGMGGKDPDTLASFLRLTADVGT